MDYLLVDYLVSLVAYTCRLWLGHCDSNPKTQPVSLGYVIISHRYWYINKNEFGYLFTGYIHRFAFLRPHYPWSLITSQMLEPVWLQLDIERRLNIHVYMTKSLSVQWNSQKEEAHCPYHPYLLYPIPLLMLPDRLQPSLALKCTAKVFCCNDKKWLIFAMKIIKSTSF